MAEANENCIICSKSLDSGPVRVIQSETIKSFIRASKQRKDEKYRQFQNHESLTIHSNCCKSYTSEKEINYAKLKFKDSASTSIGVATRSAAITNFDFKNLCFICEEDATDNFLKKQERLPANKRQNIRMVSSNDTRNTLLGKLKTVTDKLSLNVYTRLSNVEDLVSVGARYHDNCSKKLYSKFRTSVEEDETETTRAAKFIATYILEHKEECQFSINDILQNFETNESISTRYVTEYLQKIFGDDVIVHSSKDGPIITLLNAGKKIFTETWYKNRKKDIKEERKRIVEIAGKILVEDIRAQFYDITSYPAPDSFLENVNNDIPETLQLLLNTIILNNKNARERYSNKIIAIAHAIIAATRPRSFLSSLQVGLAAMINKKYGSKELLQILSSLGFCATYEESLLFEASVLSHPQSLKCNDSYFQFVFDNADHNLNTIDGKNTFHAMGGIEIITPYNSVSDSDRVPRLQKIASADVIGNFGKIDFHAFHKPFTPGMENVIVKNLNEIYPISLDIEILPADFLWLRGKSIKPNNIQGWNGFMEILTQHKHFEKSKVHCLPFVKHLPSSYDTIYSVLLEAARRCEKENQKDCFVTFDQPLYYKAREILECCKHELSRVHVRLGGFHLLMSFMGSIGFVMNGSGLKELFCEIYAENSVDKMLTGHAYARAVRGHLLAHLALGQILLSSITFSEAENQLTHNILEDLGEHTLDIIQTDEFINIVKKFNAHVKAVEKNGPTVKLWIQYFHMITVMKQFIEAERTGNWNLHLQSARKIIPYFHASGHYLYAKSCQLYLQDMYDIEEKMDPMEYHKFTENGFFTIRRTDKYWAGIWSHMAIGQILMRSMKSSGGLTHGRGITDSSLTKWTLAMPVLIDITECLQKFCNVTFSTSEQHVDARPSRIARDANDLNKLLKFLSTYEPFAYTDYISSISNGCKGNDSINCYKAFEIGLEIMNNTAGLKFKQFKYQRKNRILSLQSANSTKVIKNENVIIDPTLIFQRIAVAMDGKSELKHFLCYELAPFPLSLFDQSLMRKTQKSKLYDFFEPHKEKPFNENCSYVIDGGFLLHRVVWRQNETFDKIVQSYIDYIKKYFNGNTTIVFDGYPEDKTLCTKTAERQRRQTREIYRQITFDLSMSVTVSQEKFLSSDTNKNRLFTILRTQLEETGFLVKQAIGDACALIVQSAIEISNTNKPSVIVAEDIDILVILTQIKPADKVVYILKPGKEEIPDRVYSADSFSIKSVTNLIAFIHAFTGCDTTSAFYKQGKAKIVKLLEKNSSLREQMSIFNLPNATKKDIQSAGEKMICILYGNKKNIPLNEFRYLCFKKCSRRSAFNLANLPPTESAACLHSFRVYHQVQVWLNNNKNPVEWGWQINENLLAPSYVVGPLVPDDVLKDIRCRCIKQCTKTCGCVKHGLRCSDYCTHCRGQTCKNNEIGRVEIDEDEDSMDNNLSQQLPMEHENVDVNYSDIEGESDDNISDASDMDIDLDINVENLNKRKRHK